MPSNLQTRKASTSLTPEVFDELDRYAKAAGMTRSAFMSLALLIGMRALARQIMPEQFLTPELLAKMQAAGFGLPEQSEGNHE